MWPHYYYSSANMIELGIGRDYNYLIRFRLPARMRRHYGVAFRVARRKQLRLGST